MALEDILPFLKQPTTARNAKEAPQARSRLLEAPEREELAAEKIRAALYKKVIQRYADYINKNEEKTIPELKGMLNPRNHKLQEIKDVILLGLRQQAREDDLFARADKAFLFCANLRALNSGLGISFWLSPDDVIELGAADAFDRAIFLASLIGALEAGTAKVRVLELEGGLKHPIVIYHYGALSFLLDPSQQHDFRAFEGAIDAALKSFSFEGRKATRSLFEFDSEDFTDFQQELRG